eukprot:8758075-Prorocentrum_lima.AAC.1
MNGELLFTTSPLLVSAKGGVYFQLPSTKTMRNRELQLATRRPLQCLLRQFCNGCREAVPNKT